MAEPSADPDAALQPSDSPAGSNLVSLEIEKAEPDSNANPGTPEKSLTDLLRTVLTQIHEDLKTSKDKEAE